MSLSEAREALCYADQLAVMFPQVHSCQQGCRIAWEVWWKAVRISWGASQRQDSPGVSVSGEVAAGVACRSLADQA